MDFKKKEHAPERQHIASKFGSKSILGLRGKRQRHQEQVIFDSRFDYGEQRQSSSQDRYDQNFLCQKNVHSEQRRLDSDGSNTSEFNASYANSILRSKFAQDCELIKEDTLRESIIEERASEMLEINKKMHKVQDIYKDLAALISDQQDLIDNIDKNIDDANAYTKDGVEQIDQARQAYENPILADPFGDKLKPRDRRKIKKQTLTKTNHGECSRLCEPFAKFQEDMKTVVNDIKSVFLTCIVPDM